MILLNSLTSECYYRERRISERDSPMERKEDDEDRRDHDASALDIDKPHGKLPTLNKIFNMV